MIELCTRDASKVLYKGVYNFNFNDKQGREIGCFYEIRREMYAPAPEREDGLRFGYRHEPGMFWAFRVQGTRNGKSYGPCQSFYTASSLEDAHKSAQKKGDAMRKRMEKKFGQIVMDAA